jgi:hypothetical protein
MPDTTTQGVRSHDQVARQGPPLVIPRGITEPGSPLSSSPWAMPLSLDLIEFTSTCARVQQRTGGMT